MQRDSRKLKDTKLIYLLFIHVYIGVYPLMAYVHYPHIFFIKWICNTVANIVKYEHSAGNSGMFLHSEHAFILQFPHVL